MKILRLLLLIGLAFVTACTKPAAFEPYDGAAQEVVPGKTWQKATAPAHLGWSPGKLAAARAYADQIGSAAVMIVDNGIVVDAWGAVAAPYQLHSIRKPLMGALIGIHVEEGSIDLSETMAALGIDDNPPTLSDREKQATVHDLIRSRSGIYHPALGEAPSMKATRPRRHSHAPGSYWYYNNWDFNALGTIFEQETGSKICTEFDRRIAAPLSMEEFDPARCWYGTAATSIHRYYGIRMSARDLARFGLLYLRKGRWQDRQIVSADWVRESTTSHSPIGPGRGYGYLWRVGEGLGLFPNVSFRDPVFTHSGIGVHFVLVVPYRNLVIVHRVDSDKPGPYPESYQLGQLLWLILDAAGERDIGGNPSLASASGLRVTADNLDDTLGAGDTTLRGSVNLGLIEADARKIVIALAPDKTMAIEVEDWIKDKGRWWAEGSQVCFQWQKLRGGKRVCRYLRLDGETLKLFDLQGVFVDSYSLSWN